MVSGGLDSVFLVHALDQIQSALDLKLTLFYAHHGAADQNQLAYRDQAAALVKELAQKLNLPFETLKSEVALSSENEMREFRRKSAKTILEKYNLNGLVFAHHQDDLLETQILRLIRGAGAEAFLRPMEVFKAGELRPLLGISRKTILGEAETLGLKWIEDPSNQDSNYLRNWLRNQWLPDLEGRNPGAMASMARSFENLETALVQHFTPEFPEGLFARDGLTRPLFLTLNENQKIQCLARYIRSLGSLDFTQNQLKEILKQLDISHNEHTFKAAQLNWIVDRHFILAKA